MAKRVLILSASQGAGHLRAAEAIELALKELDPTAHVVHRDVLSLSNAAFRRVYGRGYLDMVNKAPHLLGYLYDYLGRPASSWCVTDRLRVALEKMNLGALTYLLQSGKWDLVVNTHLLPTEIIASLRRKEVIDVPQWTVTTDFETHRLWVHAPVERYFTATAEGADYLHHWGVAAEATDVTGIPIHPVFSRPKPRAACRSAWNLRGDRPVIVQLAGGFGVGPVEELFRGVLTLPMALDVVLVCGRNEKLRARIARQLSPGRHQVQVIGFTDRIDELMGAADIVLSKPGGLTSSEVLARGGALAIVDPIPGQETRNSDYLLENGAAIKINNIATLPRKLEALLNDPQRLRNLQQNALRISRPRAAFDIAERILAAPARVRSESLAAHVA